MELPAPGGGFSRAWPRYAKGQLDHPIHAADHPCACQGSIHRRDSEIGRALQLAECAARRFPFATMARWDRDAEEPNPESGGLALHRVRPRGGKINDWRAPGSSAEPPKFLRRQEARLTCRRLAKNGPPAYELSG